LKVNANAESNKALKKVDLKVFIKFLVYSYLFSLPKLFINLKSYVNSVFCFYYLILIKKLRGYLKVRRTYGKLCCNVNFKIKLLTINYLLANPF
ncbi:MAG: hypothetical protein ACN4ES_10570, partial [Cellulophaga baltica]